MGNKSIRSQIHPTINDSVSKYIQNGSNGGKEDTIDAKGESEKELESDEARSSKGLNTILASIFLVGEIAGAGILNMPEAVVNTGYTGFGILVAISIGVAYIGSRLAHCWLIIEKLSPRYKAISCRRPYTVIVEHALGNIGKWITEFCLILTLFGVSTVYLIVSSDFIYTLTNSFFPHMTACIWTLIIGFSLIPFTLFGSPKDFWPASIGALLGTLVAAVVVIVQVLIDAPHHDYNPPRSPTLKSFFLGFGSMLFSFGGASIFPTIQNDMKDREKFSISVSIAYVILMVIYVSISGVCYAVLGDKIESNILLSIGGTATKITQCLMLAHFLFAFTISINPVMQSIEDKLHIKRKFGLSRFIVRTLIVCMIIIVGLGIPNFSKILDFIGGSTVTIMSFVLPPVCYLKLSLTKDSEGQRMRNVSWAEAILLVLMVIVGIIGGAISTYTAVAEITAPSAFNETCFSQQVFYS